MIRLKNPVRTATFSALIPFALCTAPSALASEPADQLFGITQFELPVPEDIDTYVIARSRDYNNDGRDDFLCFSAGLNRFTVWLTFTNPDGTYTLSDAYEIDGASFYEVFTVAAADIDGDATPEIIAREGDYPGYRIIETDGSRQVIDVPNMSGLDFGSNDSYAPMVEHADFDNDGIEDLAFTTRSGTLHVRWSSLPEGSRHTVIGINELRDSSMMYRPADYDLDGDIDLLLHLEDTQQLMLVPGLGQVGFGQPINISSVPQTLDTAEIPIPCQLDADPSYDFVQRGPGENDITVYFNALSATPSHETSTYAERLIPLEVVPSLDGNVQPELVVARTEPLPSFPYNAALQMIFDVGASEQRLHPREIGWPVRGDATYASDFFPVPRVTLHDADGDGTPEILPIGIDDKQVLSFNPMPAQSEDYFGSDSYYIDSNPVHVLPVDLDSDPELELVVSTADALLTVDPQTGTIMSYPDFSYVFISQLADLEGDGQPELIAASTTSGRFYIVGIVGDGTLEILDTYIFEGETRLNSIEVADFNEDGRDDLIVLLGDQRRIHVYAGETGPALSGLSQITVPPGTLNFKPVSLDFNNDGHLDFAVGDLTASEIKLFAGDGTGQFMESHAISSGYPYWITAGDIDGDGNTDLVVPSYFYLSVVHYLDADGQLIRDEYLSTGGGTEAIIEDVDEDGDQDLIFSQTYANSDMSYVHLQSDAGDFSGQPLPFHNSNATSINFGDVNQDGRNDLVITATEDRSVRIHYGIPDAAPCPADLNNDGELNFFDVSAFLADQPDYNGDGEFNFFDVPAFIQDFNAGCP
ncbi:MAG: FG-GAP-like repeat-containing protein [Phycisphaerales bacterium]